MTDPENRAIFQHRAVCSYIMNFRTLEREWAERTHDVANKSVDNRVHWENRENRSESGHTIPAYTRELCVCVCMCSVFCVFVSDQPPPNTRSNIIICFISSARARTGPNVANGHSRPPRRRRDDIRFSLFGPRSRCEFCVVMIKIICLCLGRLRAREDHPCECGAQLSERRVCVYHKSMQCFTWVMCVCEIYLHSGH